MVFFGGDNWAWISFYEVLLDALHLCMGVPYGGRDLPHRATDLRNTSSHIMDAFKDFCQTSMS